jgi:hypothetical protein
MASYNFDNDDDFTLPPQLTTNTQSFDDFVNAPTTTDNTTTPIQIDDEITIKAKRKPTIKLIDRYLPLLPY